ARELDERTRELCDALHGAGPTTPVTLAAGEGGFLYLLGEPIRRFVRRGAAPLRLLTRNREQVYEALRTGEAQLGVAALELRPPGAAPPAAPVPQPRPAPRAPAPRRAPARGRRARAAPPGPRRRAAGRAPAGPGHPQRAPPRAQAQDSPRAARPRPDDRRP